MNKVKNIIIISVIVFTFNLVIGVYELFRYGVNTSLLFNFLVSLVFLAYCLFWYRKLKRKENIALVMTIIYLMLPVFAGSSQLVIIWLNEETLIFKAWVFLCISLAIGIYARLTMKWVKALKDDYTEVTTDKLTTSPNEKPMPKDED